MKLKPFAFFIFVGFYSFFYPSWVKAASLWQGFVFGNISDGNVSGFAQTPKGGSPGTTSFNRPTFEEANIKQSHVIELAGGLQYCNYFTVLDYRRLHAHGNKNLNQDLITHAQFIPAGSHFNMQSHYDWFALAVGKTFHFNTHLSFSPFLAGNWIHYRYDFMSLPKESSRAFSVFSLTGGLALAHNFNKHFSLDARGEVSIPFNNVRIYYATAGLNYAILVDPHFTLTPRIGILATSIEYEDEQTVPNHIRYTAKPQATVGFTALFTSSPMKLPGR